MVAIITGRVPRCTKSLHRMCTVARKLKWAGVDSKPWHSPTGYLWRGGCHPNGQGLAGEDGYGPKKNVATAHPLHSFTPVGAVVSRSGGAVAGQMQQPRGE
uniref:Uncharacterized protein n=1 Tax=Eutreptiella gymnastica TaxID=73025 RepID=A0A7S4CWI4_9EUGL